MLATSDESAISRKLLERLEPLCGLDVEAIEEVKSKALMMDVGEGKRIFSCGDSDDWTYYLIKGRIRLSFPDGTERVVSSSDPDMHMPLEPQRPRDSTARAATDVQVLRIRTSILEVLTPNEAGIELSDLSEQTGDAEYSLLERLFEDYAKGEISVPIMPDMAVRVSDAVKDPSADIGSVNRIVTGDPSIAARLMQVANSAAYRGVAEVDTCRDAIGRIGMNATRDVVTALVLKELFKSPSTELNAHMVNLWRHGTQIAAISSVLGKLVNGVSAERALLCGLVHDIGAVLVVTRIAEIGGDMPQGDELDELIVRLKPQFGSMALRAWEFPEDMILTAVEAEEWDRAAPGENADVCDVVQVAHLLAHIGTPELGAFPKMASLPSFKRITAGDLTPEAVLQGLEEAQSSIEELQSSLNN